MKPSNEEIYYALKEIRREKWYPTCHKQITGACALCKLFLKGELNCDDCPSRMCGIIAQYDELLRLDDIQTTVENLYIAYPDIYKQISDEIDRLLDVYK